jgi:hypothetical protein
MLPSNPRSTHLRSNARSRSAVRPSRREPDRYQTPAFDSQKPQQTAPPLPTTNSYSATNRNYPSYHKSRDSGSSTASSNSSYRGGRTGYASSRTSLEDNEPIHPKDAYSRDLRSQSSRDHGPSQDDAMDGSGSTLWNGFVHVASSLTVNVSKAWASNDNTQDGEETPAGQESRLTRAMKAYHLEKARDPSDLPAWLFNERERGVKGSTGGRTGYDDTRTDTPEIREEPPIIQSSGFRAIYASAASSDVQRSHRSEPTRYGDDGITQSKAANRLRAMREPKRGRVDATEEAVAVMERPLVSDGNGDGKPPVGNLNSSKRVPRVGLPSGPMRGRRK